MDIRNLFIEIEKGCSVKLFQEWINTGIDVNYRRGLFEDSLLKDAALYSIRGENKKIVKMLVCDLFANLDIRDAPGSSPLIVAVNEAGLCSTIDAVKILIFAGADVNLKSNFGFTALGFAVDSSRARSFQVRGAKETVRILAEAGAEIIPKYCHDTPIRRWWSACYWCCDAEFSVVLDILIEAI